MRVSSSNSINWLFNLIFSTSLYSIVYSIFEPFYQEISSKSGIKINICKPAVKSCGISFLQTVMSMEAMKWKRSSLAYVVDEYFSIRRTNMIDFVKVNKRKELLWLPVNMGDCLINEQNLRATWAQYMHVGWNDLSYSSNQLCMQ